MTPEHKEKMRQGRARARARREAVDRASESYAVGGDRAPREAEMRPAERLFEYRPPGLLPDIDPGPGYVFRWVRREMLGELDVTNWQVRRREGWEPIPLGDVPEVADLVDADGSGLISIGGLVACRAPVSLMNARAAHYGNFVRSRAQSLDEQYLSMRDKGVKVYKETPPRGGGFGEDEG